jgi:AcrR family transcriptional regulator
MTSLRDAYKDQTRERILDAALAEMAETESLTMKGVAARAGVTERTVFRHFATRDLLIEAIWPRMQSRVRSRGFPNTADTLIGMPGYLFPEFDKEAGLVRASVYSPAGREVRLRANEQRQAAFLQAVADAHPHLDPARRRRLAAVCQLINSAYAWSVMKEFWDLDGEGAGQAASEALSVLLGRSPAADPSVPKKDDEKTP